MSNPIGKEDQLVIIVQQKQPFRGGTWRGSLEIDAGEHSYADILKLANDDPSSIVRVCKFGKNGYEDLTDKVLDWEEEQRRK